jgi:hypothetical protein
MRDEALRIACFSRLTVLAAQYDDEIPYRGALESVFNFGGRKIPFLSPQNGIFRARAQTGTKIPQNRGWYSVDSRDMLAERGDMPPHHLFKGR